jgi:CheY-like chemotaxis protein
MPKVQDTILIVDDDRESRSSYELVARAAGFRVQPVQGPVRNVGELLEVARKWKAKFALCDHRLSEGHYARFSGAEAVARCNQTHLPAVLTTRYQRSDVDTSIRQWRRWIPCLVPSTDISPPNLRAACETCQREVVDSIVPVGRRGYRAVLTVKDIVPKANDNVVKVIVTQWNPREQVGFPLSMLPAQLRRRIEMGSFLLATVNTAAESSDDLFFEDFELPHPDDVKSVLAQFSGR